jgi:Pvc16 N-terminal domain
VIGDALDFTKKVVAAHLGIAVDEVQINSARKLADGENPAGAIISLINVQEEAALKNTSHVERRLGELKYIEPPVYVNLFLLFAFDFAAYPTSLTHLSKTIELFQAKRWFGPATQSGPGAVPFPATLEKLVFDMVNLNFEELNNLWGVLGGTYLPSAIYKVRLVKIQLQQDMAAPEVTTIQLDTALLR